MLFSPTNRSTSTPERRVAPTYEHNTYFRAPDPEQLTARLAMISPSPRNSQHHMVTRSGRRLGTPRRRARQVPRQSPAVFSAGENYAIVS